MADKLINLNRARKERGRAEQKAKAEENRARFGRTKAEKAKAQSASDKLNQALDGARRDPPAKA